MKGKSAIRYAQSLLELATERKQEEALEKDMITMYNVIDETPEFRAFLKNPIIKEDKKNQVMDAVFGKHVSELAIKFVHLIVKNKREKELKEICLAYIDLFKKQRNILVAELTASTKLDDSTKETIMKKIREIHDGEIELVQKIDSNLLGGFVLKIDDKQLDATIASKLRALRKELIYN